ncbi:FixH family protein [Parapedobacter koreensis]|uniref:FixH protein n=1 Tax=Parapedobacter koreensis TaxID=332977 RepID=A0A1H7JL26_9SPHI|nr:FixH family protein [Parapedobacter koreensis]SEK75076.1 FixH protein [Parapedobacter koreensis]
MDWGIKIAISLVLFMALIISFGIYMVSNDTDSLVAEDYYEQGLNYDKLHKPDSVRIDNDSLTVKPNR